MKRLAKNLITATLIGSAFLVAGLSSASSSELNSAPTFINLDDESTTTREEFWDKFRRSVEPREKNPPPPASGARPPERYAPPPKEVHPKEIQPREVHPKEVS